MVERAYSQNKASQCEARVDSGDKGYYTTQLNNLELTECPYYTFS